MEAFSDYLETIKTLIDQVRDEESPKVAEIADLLAEQVLLGKLIYLWGPGGHSSIFSEDAMYRKGELAALCPIYDPNISLSHGAAREINGMERVEGFAQVVVEYHRIGPGDVVLFGSAYGINPVAIQGALECKARGATVIAITSPAFSDASTYGGARHTSGKSLYQVADYYLDSKVPYGDAVLEYDAMEHKISPVATIMQAIVLKALLAQTMVVIGQKGGTPFTWTNSLQAGGIEANQEYMNRIWGKVKSM
ncbi:MAG: sugar isomerase domain-containing protein [Oscillospiraceae bacterium]|jgi:uncharacterized phosphosugar-binding protein